MNPKEERKLDAEKGHIKELKDKKYICNCMQGEDYVFISYSSLNWKKVLYDIVYETCTKYGLRVYFDTEFDVGSDSWLTQFQDNMWDKHCKAVLAFFSPEYYSSYATLMELMATQVVDAGDKLVLPIDLGSYDITSTENTGLGTYRFSDNSINELWGKEMKLFDELFDELFESKVFPRLARVWYKYKEFDESNTKEAYWEALEYESLSHNEAYWNSQNIHTEEEKREHWDKLEQSKKKKVNGMYLSKKKNSKLMQMLRQEIDKNAINGVNKDIPKTIHDKLVAAGLGSVFDDAKIEVPEPEKNDVPDTGVPKPGKNDVQDTGVPKPEKNDVQDTGVPEPEKNDVQDTGRTTPLPPEADGYAYTVFGKEYHAGKREQGKLMYDVYAALTEKYPDKADILTARTSIARAEDVTGPNTKDAKPVYFRACKKFTVGTQDYYVGTSYGFDAKIAEIKGMLKLCGESKDAFCLLEHKGDSKNEEAGGTDIIGKSDTTDVTEDRGSGTPVAIDRDLFQYKLWGRSYTADKLAAMMHDVFDLIMDKYPEKIEAIEQKQGITAVAAKEAVDQKKLPVSKLNYFRSKKEHKVGDRLYYVGTSYNREDGIKQLRRMLTICEGNSNAFEIEVMPEKAQRGGYSSGSDKKSLAEILKN